MDVVALELCRALLQIKSDFSYVLLAADGPDRSCIQKGERFDIEVVSGFTYADWEQFSLPRALKRIKPAAVHCMCNTAPVRCPVPLILTLHDIIYLEETSFGGSAYQNFGNLYRRAVVPQAIRKAKTIVTVSDFERKVIADYIPAAAEKLEVVPNAVDGRFNVHYPPESIDAFRKKYGLPQNFILLLGNTAPKKNTATALRAYEHYCELTRDPLPLVVADFSVGTTSKGTIVCPGYIPSEEMPLLYNCASLFLYPSLRESFGLPILEAMACGVPVITSDASALPEVAGGAARLIQPESAREIGEAIMEVLADSSLIESYKQKGLARASQFSWEKSAQKLVALYSQIY